MGVEDEVSTLKMYPNPVRDYLYFNDNDPGIENAYLYNLSGQLVGTFVLSRQVDVMTGQFDVRELPAGIYFVMVERVDGRRERVKVVRE
jgi:hypothetical protein